MKRKSFAAKTRNRYVLAERERLYHVTTSDRLPGIEHYGLRPGHEPNIGSEAYDANRDGAVFLTEFDGLSFWTTAAENWIEHRYEPEDILEGGIVAVVLAVPGNVEAEPDEVGTHDSRHAAYRTTVRIAPRDIEIFWNHWMPISRWREINFSTAFEIGDQPYFRQKNNPFMPTTK